jgi:hypothetical protein
MIKKIHENNDGRAMNLNYLLNCVEGVGSREIKETSK